METPPAEEKLAGLSGDDSTHSASDISRLQESHKPVNSPPRRSGIPPKRLSGVAQRPAASTPISTTKPSPASATRRPNGSGLSKPPTRPTASSSSRRPISGVSASTAASSGHRARPSTSSIEDDKKSIVGPDEENRRPTGLSSAKRVSIAPAQSNRPTTLKATSSSSDRRNALTASTAADKKTPPSRTGASSPTKGILKSASNNAKPVGDSSNLRTSRPPPSSSRTVAGLTASDSFKKRLSTIPASPTPVSSDLVPPVSKASIDDTSVKPLRPGLVTRKSTMSITIEQRLREMELVNEMLQAAMAEDGDEEDEVKEEYGRKVDEQLASLRGKLEEARRNEGKDHIEVPETISSPSRETGTADAPPLQAGSHDENPEALSSALFDSQQKVSSLEAEIVAMNTKMLDLSVAAENAAKEIQRTTEDLHAQHTAKIKELSMIQKAELEAIRTKLTEAETQRKQPIEESTRDTEDAKRNSINESSDDTSILLEDQMKSYRDAVKSLEEDLISEKSSKSDLAFKLESLSTEVSALAKQLDQEKSRSTRYLDDAKAKLERMTQEKDELITVKDNEKSKLQHELEKLQITHNKELELAHQEATHRINRLETEQNSSAARLRELENEGGNVPSTHHDVLQDKERETSSLSQVIDSLQDQLQHLQESKDQELDASKVELIQAHEAVMLKLRAQYESEIGEVRDAAEQKVTSESMRYKNEAKNLHEEIKKLRIDRENASSETLLLKSEKEEIMCLLESERGSNQDTRQVLEKSLEAALDELASLKKVLDTFNEDNQDNGQKYEVSINEMKDQLESTEKMLEERSKEVSSVSDKHAMDLEQLRDRHSKDVAEINERRDNAFKEFQASYDTLLKTWKDEKNSHSIALEAAKTENLKLLEDTRNSHGVEMKEHEKRYQATRQSHQNVLSDLQDQVIQSRKALSSAEHELQLIREAQSKTHSDDRDNNKLELEGLQEQLSQAKSEVSTTRAELDSVRQQKLQAETLKRRYSVEGKDLRSALAHDKETIDKLTAAVEEASNVMPDTSEADRLRENISELTKQHAAEISKIQETMNVENEKRDKERKQGADVRDRLAAELRELESVRRDLPAVKEEAEQYRKDAELARLEMLDAQTRLDQALTASQDQETQHRDTLAKIDLLQSELKKARKRSATPKGHGRKDSSHAQECDALQTMVDKEREQNKKLKKQLDEAQATADRHATRAREKDAALKVTTAELTELRTKRTDGRDFTSSPTPTKTLRTSRWASNENEDNESADLDGEVLGSHIEGTIAGIQEQIRQIEGVHYDMLDDQKRSVRSYRSVVRADRFC